jgi:hypothetical protein
MHPEFQSCIVEQNLLAKVNAVFCFCLHLCLVQLDTLCSLILVLLEQMVCPTYVFPHLQGRQYISNDCRSRSLDGTKHTGDFPGKILLWCHLWLRWVNSIWICLDLYLLFWHVVQSMFQSGGFWLQMIMALCSKVDSTADLLAVLTCT